MDGGGLLTALKPEGRTYKSCGVENNRCLGPVPTPNDVYRT